MKRCNRCQLTKPYDEFHVRRKSKDGRQPRCKVCQSAIGKDHYARTREAQIAAAKAWNLANPEKRRVTKKRHADKYRERYTLASREWRKKNPGVTDAMRRWWRAHPDKVRAYHVNRSGAVGVATAEQIASRIAFYGGRCWMCGCDADTMDHVIALSRGGTNWPANLRPACMKCNSRKGPRSWREAAGA